MAGEMQLTHVCGPKSQPIQNISCLHSVLRSFSNILPVNIERAVNYVAHSDDATLHNALLGRLAAEQSDYSTIRLVK
jgi:hypothetical protein